MRVKLTVGVLFTALGLTVAAPAMEISQFDTMTSNDRSDYTAYLMKSACDLLTSEGKATDAQKLWSLFEQTDGHRTSVVMVQFDKNLDIARQENQKHAGDPYKKPIDIEHAFALTLKENGIVVPASKLLLITQNYKPSSGGTPPAH
jgi:DNA-binding NtrC family response regulator